MLCLYSNLLVLLVLGFSLNYTYINTETIVIKKSNNNVTINDVSIKKTIYKVLIHFSEFDGKTNWIFI